MTSKNEAIDASIGLPIHPVRSIPDVLLSVIGQSSTGALRRSIVSLQRLLTIVAPEDSSSSISSSNPPSTLKPDHKIPHSALTQTFVDLSIKSAISLYNISSSPSVLPLPSINGGGKRRQKPKKKVVWDALQDAASCLVTLSAPKDDEKQDVKEEKEQEEAEAMAVVAVLAALALRYPPSTFSPPPDDDEDIDNGYNDEEGGVDPSRAAGSAIAAVVSRRRTSGPSSARWTKESRQIGERSLMALLRLISKKCHDENRREVTNIDVDLQLVTFLARSFEITSSSSTSPDEVASTTANAIRRALHIIDTDTSRTDGEAPSPLPPKRNVAPALLLAQQIAPWLYLNPVTPIEIAVGYHLWHGAENICASSTSFFFPSLSDVNGERNSSPFLSSPTPLCPSFSAWRAVETLIDSSFEARLYRHADHFATKFYAVGGRSRFVKARRLHAYSTIYKFVSKGQIPLIERQVERVDRAVLRVNEDIQKCVERCDEQDKRIEEEEAKEAIRRYVIGRLERAGRWDAVHRFVTAWGSQYGSSEVSQEERERVEKERKEKYLQLEDALPKMKKQPPEIVNSVEDLEKAFADDLGLVVWDEEIVTITGIGNSKTASRIIVGFDAEWGDEGSGVDLLQIATHNAVVLIDLPAVSKSPGGGDVLKRTVGYLFDGRLRGKCDGSSGGGGETVLVVGFECKQDLKRLRASPCPSFSNDGNSSDSSVELKRQRRTRAFAKPRTAHRLPKKRRRYRHWLSSTSSVVDLAHLGVEYDDPKLRKLGLSRYCERYLGKPLDKAEQCSMWNARPLTDAQKEYAALDAWVCVAIYRKIFGDGDDGGGGRLSVERVESGSESGNEG